MGLQRRYALFELQKQLAPSEPDVHEFIIGLDSIAKAAGYSPDYFHKRYLDVPASKQVVGSGVLSCHTGLGHYYLYRGEPVTHPSSAAAWGANAARWSSRSGRPGHQAGIARRLARCRLGRPQAACMSPSPLPHWGRISRCVIFP